MKILLGTKEKMTQIFSEEGKVFPVTEISAGPVVVTQVKTSDKDGYNGVQVGYGERAVKNINKAQLSQFKDMGNFRYLKEFKLPISEETKVGESVDVDSFEEGDKIRISSFSKGKGFQGVVKRHGFKGGPRTHGQKHSEREPGSIGSTGPQRVFKGTRMGGRMGNDRVTLKDVEIIKIDKKNNKIFVKGAVPGRRGTLIELQG
jgi:large subunit ribosomal protein L3